MFFAIQHAQSALLSMDEVGRFITPFDERILDSVSSLWLNIAHIHGKNLYFNEIPKKKHLCSKLARQRDGTLLARGKEGFSRGCLRRLASMGYFGVWNS